MWPPILTSARHLLIDGSHGHSRRVSSCFAEHPEPDGLDDTRHCPGNCGASWIAVENKITQFTADQRGSRTKDADADDDNDCLCLLVNMFSMSYYRDGSRGGGGGGGGVTVLLFVKQM